MTNKHKEFVDKWLSEGKSEAEIIKSLLGRLERKDDLMEAYRKSNKEYKQEMIKAQFESGRRKSIGVDTVIRTIWGSYVYYNHTRYRYNERMKAWVEDTDQNSLMQHHMRSSHGRFYLDVVLADKDMPKKFTGICSGQLDNKKIILSPDSTVNYGDVFVMYKQEKKK